MLRVEPVPEALIASHVLLGDHASVPPGGAMTPPGRAGEIDAKHAQLMSAFVTATRSGDLNALMQLLASDVHVMTDGGGKVTAALNVLDGADHAARFLVGTARKGWRDDFTLRF